MHRDVYEAAVKLHDWFSAETDSHVFKTCESHPWFPLSEEEEREQLVNAVRLVTSYIVDGATNHNLPNGEMIMNPWKKKKPLPLIQENTCTM